MFIQLKLQFQFLKNDNNWSNSCNDVIKCTIVYNHCDLCGVTIYKSNIHSFDHG